jgi:excinuclease ABC subunit B
MAEDLTDYLTGLNIQVQYLHSDIATLDRVQILRELRMGKFDVLVGINLLREGLDLPEVSLVAVLDADKEGFLRSKSALLQVAGRASRNIEGFVILYGDKITDAMKNLVDTTKQRRKIQADFNRKHGITPKTIYKSIDDILISTAVADSRQKKEDVYVPGYDKAHLPEADKQMILIELRKAMLESAEHLEFEKAAKIRDEIEEFEKDLGITV